MNKYGPLSLLINYLRFRHHLPVFVTLRVEYDLLLQELNIQCDSKRLTQIRTSIFPELYMVCE